MRRSKEKSESHNWEDEKSKSDEKCLSVIVDIWHIYEIWTPLSGFVSNAISINTSYEAIWPIRYMHVGGPARTCM